jgi:hypothetical protein
LQGDEPNIRFAETGQADANIGTNNGVFYVVGDIGSDGAYNAASDTIPFSVNLTNGNTSILGTMTASTFSGSGASLTSIPAGELTGNVSSARLPNASQSASGIVTTSSQQFAGAKAFITGGNTITTHSGFSTPLTINGAGGGQTVPLTQWGTGGYVRGDGNAIIFGGIYATYNMTVDSGATGSVPMVVTGASGQSANLQEWRNSTPTTVASVSPSGAFTTEGPIISAYSGGWGTPNIVLNGAQPSIRFADAGQQDAHIGINDNNFYILGDTDSNGAFDTVPFSLSLAGGGMNTAGTFTSAGNIVTGGNGTFENLKGTGTRNVNSTSGGILTNSTSSERYKEDIVDAEYNYEDILRLQPKTFKLKSEVEELENPITYAGFIAEDVDQIDSLKVFVGYARTEDGQLIPDSLYYAEMVSALLSAIKHQDSIIKSLQARVENLEN